MNYIKILFLILFFYSCSSLEIIKVADGWAGNSINTVIFRNSLVSFNDHQYCSFYDKDGNVVLAKRKLNSSDWEIKRTEYNGNIRDAHNSISLGIDSEGYLHLSWNQHNTQLNYCKSIKPECLEMSNKLEMTGINENNVTYPQFYKYKDNLLFLYRGEKNQLVIYIYKDNEWSVVQNNLIKNAYWQVYIKDSIIHLTWTWRETANVNSNHDICYAKSYDGLDWYKMNGDKYELPITKETAEYAKNIPRNNGLINQTSMSVDSKGNPYIITYWNSQYQLVYYDDGWKDEQITNRITNFKLNGIGTKGIPISRPLILLDKRDKIYIIFRDIERGNKVSMLSKLNGEWIVDDVTSFSVGMFEPTCDIDLWKNRNEMNLFIQNVEQENNDIIDSVSIQGIYILKIDL